MRKYYTRPCNFYYGSNARKLIKNKKAHCLAGNSDIAFDQLEIFQRKKKGIITSNVYPIAKIKTLNKEIIFTSQYIEGYGRKSCRRNDFWT